MVWSKFHSGHGANRNQRRAFVPGSELLEPRTLLSGLTVTVGIAPAKLNPKARSTKSRNTGRMHSRFSGRSRAR